MAKIILINTLFRIENVLGIYRNMSSLRNISKIFALLRVISQVGLLTLIGASFEVQAFIGGSEYGFVQLIFFHSFNIVTSINCLMPIITSINKTDSFKILISTIDDVYKYCNEGTDYEKRLNKLRKRVLTVLFFMIICYVLLFVQSFIQWDEMYKDMSTSMYYGSILQSIMAYWREVSFQLEFLVFNVYVRIITVSLSYLKIKLEHLVDIIMAEDNIDEITYSKRLSDLVEWTTAYRHVAICNDVLVKSFRSQIAFSLFILTTYFIGLSYSSILTIISDNTAGGSFTIFILLNYSMAVVSLLYISQRAQNEAEGLIRLIIKLWNRLLTVPGSKKVATIILVKDFSRLMLVKPLKIQVLSTVTVDMSLLLVILSTTISYTIVMLQFNHVV